MPGVALCGSVRACSGAGGIFARPDPLRGSRGLLAALPLVKKSFKPRTGITLVGGQCMRSRCAVLFRAPCRVGDPIKNLRACINISVYAGISPVGGPLAVDLIFSARGLSAWCRCRWLPGSVPLWGVRLLKF